MKAPLLCLTIALLASPAFSQQASFTRGSAKQINPGLFDCGSKSRVSAVGTITSEDGKVWTVPAETSFKTAAKAADLYNECAGNTPSSVSGVDMSAVPVLDAGGRVEFVAYIFADNYFELYVNGKLLAVDAVPFTPFNSSVVRFKAHRPFVVAVMSVDWEENLGLGSERNRGFDYHPGDAGLVAVIKDDKGQTIAITDQSWRAQTFYTAPLSDRSCLKLKGPVRDSSACSTSGVQDGKSFSAAHWQVPANWFAPKFDASSWPMAVTYSNDTVGVDNKPAYVNFRDVFDDPRADAAFIWSSNLSLDNLVLMRRTVE